MLSTTMPHSPVTSRRPGPSPPTRMEASIDTPPITSYPALPPPSSNHSQMPPFAPPPTFSGTPNEDPLDWLEAYELAAHQNRWCNPTKRYFVSLYLTDTALAWYRLHQAVHTTLPWSESDHAGLDTPTSFTTQFRRRFCTPHWQTYWLERLTGAQQHAEESVEMFCYRVQQLAARADVGTAQVQRVVYCGAQRSLAEAAQLQPDLSVEEMLQALCRIEQLRMLPPTPAAMSNYCSDRPRAVPVAAVAANNYRTRTSRLVKVPDTLTGRSSKSSPTDQHRFPDILTAAALTPVVAPITPTKVTVSPKYAAPTIPPPLDVRTRCDRARQRDFGVSASVEAFLATL